MRTAKQQRQATQHSATYKAIEDALREHEGPDNEVHVYAYEDDDLRDWELDEIRELGYKITWNRARLRYKITW